MSGRDDFDRVREALMARKREELGAPPTPEELLAWRDDRLDREARDLLAAKLAVYPDAARALADLAAFPDVRPAPGTPELSDAEVDAGWESFRRRLETLPPPVAHRPASPSVLPFPDPVPARLAHPARPARWLQAIAAVLLLATGFGAGHLVGTRPSPPAANVVIAQLDPLDDAGAATRAAPAEVELAPGAGGLVLILAFPETRGYPTYTAEILDHRGRRLWVVDGLEVTSLGTVQLSLDRSAVPAQDVRIELFGKDGVAKRTQVARYELRLR